MCGACLFTGLLLQYRPVCIRKIGDHAINQLYKEGSMASKKGNRIVIKLRSTESGHTYTTLKNRKNDPNRLELRRYDPLVRRHVAYRETK
jgi:large subunit ribosomal protein L33